MLVFGVLGYVMATHNPVRVAEETAVINHLARGRSFVGLARGYQSRWTNVLGQHFGTRATKSPSAAIYNPATQGAGFSTATQVEKDLDDDRANREIFEDHVEIMLKAWTQESFDHNTKRWQIPYPYETGVTDWPLARAGVTQKFGAPGEVDETGATRRVSVAPAPYTRPHPPVFLSGSGSPETIAFRQARLRADVFLQPAIRAATGRRVPQVRRPARALVRPGREPVRRAL